MVCRRSQVQRMDTHHCLRGDGPGLSQWVYGLATEVVAQWWNFQKRRTLQPTMRFYNQPVQGKENPMLPADLVSVGVEDRNVVLIPQLRGSVRPLQSVAA